MSNSLKYLGSKNNFIKNLKYQLSHTKIISAKLEEVEILKSKLEKDHRKILLNHLGTSNKNKIVEISAIARHSSSTKRDRRILFALATMQQPDLIIELGSSLGFATATLALACSEGTVISIEGNNEIAFQARENLNSLKINNVDLLNGSFEVMVPSVLVKLNSKKFLVFIDGNHTYEATINYYHQFSQKASSGSTLVFHDIYWSAGMKKAWDEICDDKKNKLCINLYSLGIVYFQDEQNEVLNLRYW